MNVLALLMLEQIGNSRSCSNRRSARGIDRTGCEKLEERKIRDQLPVRYMDRYAAPPRITNHAVFSAYVAHRDEDGSRPREIRTPGGAMPMFHRETIDEAAGRRIDPLREENHIIAADHREPQQIQRPRGTADHHDAVVVGR